MWDADIPTHMHGTAPMPSHTWVRDALEEMGKIPHPQGCSEVEHCDSASNGRESNFRIYECSFKSTQAPTRKVHVTHHVCNCLAPVHQCAKVRKTTRSAPSGLTCSWTARADCPAA